MIKYTTKNIAGQTQDIIIDRRAVSTTTYPMNGTIEIVLTGSDGAIYQRFTALDSYIR